jgi:ABC-type bacteriocin/lantibiotic exporter with double-glycine peptidase domain
MKTQFTPTTARDPIAEMIGTLTASGRIKEKDQDSEWINCLCALTLTLEPPCKTYRFLEAIPYSRHSLDNVDVLNTMANLGYFAQSSQQKLEDIDPRLLPSFFIDHFGKPSVIIEKGEENTRVFRNNQIETLSTRDITTIFGTSWFFQHYDENKTDTSKFMRGGSGFSWFRAVLTRFKGTLGQIFLSGLFINIIALAIPLFIILIYSRVIGSVSVGTLPMLAVGMALAIGLEYCFRRIRSQSLSWLAGRMDNIVGNRIFSHLIGLPPDLIERASVAAQIARIKTFESVRDFFSGSVFLSMMEIPYVILSLAAIYAIAGKLVFVPLAMVAAYVLLFWVAHRRIKSIIRLAAKTSSARQQFTIETFEKIRGIRSYGMSKLWQEKFRTLSGQEMMAHFHLNFLGMISETIAHSLTVLSAIFTVGFGVHLIWSGQIGTGALVATMILVWRVLTPFYSMCTMIPRLEQLRNSVMQVNTLMDLNTEAIDARVAARLPRMRGQVFFNHTLFRYNEKSDPVFHDLTFEARAGDLVIITGENGAGKTTILKLVKGLYKASEGSVQIDGFDIRQLDAPDLRRQIAYVPQQTDFFYASIAENLRAGNPLATDEDIRRALDLADASEEVMALSHGVDTIIGRSGKLPLSSMFMAKLSLARAYLHRAPLILIDELPNTLLGGRAGKNLKDYLARNKGSKTCLMVTYRDDFIRIADTVILLQRGEKPITGTPSDIIDKNNVEAA